MKKLLLFVGLVSTTLFLVACSTKTKLVVYIPNDYINKDIVRKFEKENGVKVKLSTFDSNEVALSQIRSNVYDVVIPSDYAIEELVSEDLLMEIDYHELLGNNIEFSASLEVFLDQLKDEGFDFRKYAVPYFWGSFGILYNKNKISEDRIKEEGFNIIADQSLETVIYDSSRDALMVGMLVNGKNLHDDTRTLVETKADVLKAEEWLKKAKGPKTSILSDEILSDMESGTPFDAVMSYSGDAVYIMSENSNYDYYMPENTNVWADGFVIPKNSKQPDLAKEFIKYMTSYDAVYENSLEIGYSAVRADVLNDLIEDEFSASNLAYAYEPKVEPFQIYRFDKELKKLLDESWARIILT